MYNWHRRRRRYQYAFPLCMADGTAHTRVMNPGRSFSIYKVGLIFYIFRISGNQMVSGKQYDLGHALATSLAQFQKARSTDFRPSGAQNINQMIVIGLALSAWGIRRRRKVPAGPWAAQLAASALFCSHFHRFLVEVFNDITGWLSKLFHQSEPWNYDYWAHCFDTITNRFYIFI